MRLRLLSMVASIMLLTLVNCGRQAAREVSYDKLHTQPIESVAATLSDMPRTEIDVDRGFHSSRLAQASGTLARRRFGFDPDLTPS